MHPSPASPVERPTSTEAAPSKSGGYAVKKKHTMTKTDYAAIAAYIEATASEEAKTLLKWYQRYRARGLCPVSAASDALSAAWDAGLYELCQAVESDHQRPLTAEESAKREAAEAARNAFLAEQDRQTAAEEALLASLALADGLSAGQLAKLAKIVGGAVRTSYNAPQKGHVILSYRRGGTTANSRGHISDSWESSWEIWTPARAITPEDVAQACQPELINLTPHDVVLCAPDSGAPVVTVPKSGHVARVEVQVSPTGESIHGLPVVRSEVSERVTLDPPMWVGTPCLDERQIHTLPEERAGVRYIVSGMVLAAAPRRGDLLAPGDLVRDPQGRVIGCKSLVKGGAL